MLATIQRWGSSLGIRIPKSVLEDAGLSLNDRVELTPTSDGFAAHKVNPPMRHRTLKERLEEFYGLPIDEIQRSASEPEIDWGPPVGEEIW